MKTILIPTDFSATSKNASLYAIDMAATIGIPKIVFYHFYETKLIYTPAGELDEVASIEPNREKSIAELDAFIDSLGTIPERIEIESYQGAGSVNEGVVEVAAIVAADLIVMGIAPGGLFKETFLGSHALSVAKHVSTPVLIVPASATFNKLEKVTLLSDFKNVEGSVPVNKIKVFLEHGFLELSILHLLSYDEEIDNNHPEKQKLETLFKEYAPQFKYKESGHYTDDIIDFTAENDVDILIVVPEYHSLIETLFNDHTKKLAFHSKVPLLIAHK
ncbi:universal stress protein [Parasediminibacterium sp. JCM 36343]|uniref:universal stress protein n=1 Tax=Parasediminibacterium sp. JCM 36343 TaxID=3374279 RepID=UPI003978D4CC